eukprot:scaffold631077_cov45-Prasinocladus_malaysianus.AAC.1
MHVLSYLLRPRSRSTRSPLASESKHLTIEDEPAFARRSDLGTHVKLTMSLAQPAVAVRQFAALATSARWASSAVPSAAQASESDNLSKILMQQISEMRSAGIYKTERLIVSPQEAAISEC